MKARGCWIALVALFCTVASVSAQTVLHRERLGNRVEDITALPSGDVVMLDGADVYSIPKTGEPAKLFSTKVMDGYTFANGITYVQSERLFALVTGSDIRKLFIIDTKGKPATPRTIQYPADYTPDSVEGLAYLPAKSTFYPDHILMAAVRYWTVTESRIEVLSRDGQIVAEIIPQEPVRSGWITGLTVYGTDRLLVSLSGGNQIFTLDFAGNIVGEPVTAPETEGFEGLVQLPNGKVVASEYRTGILRLFDAQLNRRRAEDQTHRIGACGLSTTVGLAWNPDTQRYLVGNSGPGSTNAYYSVTYTLDALPALLTFPGAGGFTRSMWITYLPDEHRMAAIKWNPPAALQFFDASGALVETMDLSAYGRPNAVGYIPTTREFAFRFQSNPNLLRILSRTGAPVRDIDLTPLGLVAVGHPVFFNPAHPSGGQFLFSDGNTIAVTDFNGNLIFSFNVHQVLGIDSLVGLTAITNGPEAGSFAALDRNSVEIVVFNLN